MEQAAGLSKKKRKAARKIERKAAYHALEKRVPPLAAGAAVVIAAMLVFKGLKNVGLDLSLGGGILLLIMVGIAVWMAVTVFARALKKQSISRATFIMFSWMQVFTASAFAFSHGANDIANAVGPFAAVLDVLSTGEISEEAAVPTAVLAAFGIALISGLWFVGRKVIATVGSGLTSMHPSSGFAAEARCGGRGDAGFRAGTPGLLDAHPDRRRPRRGHREPCGELEAHEADRPCLGDHAPRRGQHRRCRGARAARDLLSRMRPD